MTNKFSTRRLCTAAFLVAVGLILPQIFHMVGGKAVGSVFSPMHLPVLVSGLLLGPALGAAVGFLTPLLSALATGMPPMAILPFMLCELTAYGAVSGVLARKFPLYPSLIGAQVAGRVVYAAALFVGGTVFGMQCAAPASVLTSIVTGLPGIVLQLALAPAVVLLLHKALPESV
ncbi:ECF transporter S component [Butyricicoccus sp. Marseille-Q5471]|uniref:ECF transporter S component n=1 Tax=Butyricicoccus sp. Marseille-Q5471 TaxID=3039493 RepID=UPI0024BC54C4|nr:ECF transporter S component [Butyricicoccus sp. Marseille-Q5471]